MKFQTLIYFTAGLVLLASTQGLTAAFVRPDYQNVSGPAAVDSPPRDPNPGLTHIQGHIKPHNSAPADGLQKLTEASFGQPFAPFAIRSTSNQYQSYAQEIIDQVKPLLYPPSGSNRAVVEASTAAFRYKWLLFSPNEGETDVTTHFDGMVEWWTDDERALANEQIAVLRSALAISPTDTGLRDLLLEVYYDYAIAEMQIAKQKLAVLASQRLGLVTTTPFIIDAEIQEYETLIALEQSVLEKYAELLALDGIDPSEFDERESPGTPFGLYLFKKQQPYRNSIASEYATETGVETIPDYDEGTQQSVPRTPENLVLFSGYKDYVTLLTIMAQFTQHEAELARLRGMRQGTNDLTLARNTLSKIQSETATDFLLLRWMFGGDSAITGVTPGNPVIVESPAHGLSTGAGIEIKDVIGTFGANGKFAVTVLDADHFSLNDSEDSDEYVSGGQWRIKPGNASGVTGAINGMEIALADITNVRAFLNGDANILGLDESFLLLVQDPAPVGPSGIPPVPRDSFDVLYENLKGDNQPLTDALAKMADATSKYQNFRASVDQVVKEIQDVDSTFQQRFQEITGYTVDEDPGFKGLAKLNSGSELDDVEKSIASLQSRNETLSVLNNEIANNLTQANSSLSIANGLNGKIQAAQLEYNTKVSNAYEKIGLQTGLAASTQSSFEATQTIAGLDTLKLGEAVVVAASSAINSVGQISAAKENAAREAEIDIAAVNFESELQKADNALTVNQARQEVGAILREQHSIRLEMTDNSLALSQSLARRTSLLGEVQIITAKREADQVRVRSAYYADPIQYVRSENALILADAAFRNAQRWVFYTQRALEYKWQQAFVRSESSAQGIRNFDSGTLFKLRNATELDDLLTQLKAWNDDRVTQDSSSIKTTFISFKDHILARNPNILNATPALRADPGIRTDLETGELVTQEQLFQRLLARTLDNGGNLNVDFSTADLDAVLTDFFVGPNYSVSPLAPGEWRDKIVYIKVNIIAKDGTSIPQTIAGALTYGGQTLFRTRIPPCVDRTVHLPDGSANGATPTDLPGEFMTAPFRYYTSASYNNVFSATDAQTQNITASYLGASAKGPNGEETIGQTYQFNSFNQYSVAATRWRLSLFPPLTGWDVSQIEDIELVIKHKSSARLAPVCP